MVRPFPMSIALPYFDMLLPQLESGEPSFRTAFGRHVHWGYWDDVPDGSLEDFAEAAERMCRRVCDAGRVSDGQQILDVGCGLGGTLASLNDRLRGVSLTGLNIDPRQLAYARGQLEARPGNAIDLVQGDACAMPFDDESFDVVLAVECAFHVPSRERFVREAVRVLRPGGRLALCDFMPLHAALPLLVAQRLFFSGYVNRIVGPTDLTYSLERYLEVATRLGLRHAHDEDVTLNTLATYPVVRKIARLLGMHVATAHWGTAGMQLLGRLGILRYVILALDKP